MKRLAYLLVAVALIPATVSAQALTSLSSLRVRYNTSKETEQPTGELKERIDAIDRDLAAATRAGRTGEVRRLLAKGTSLLAGRAWTPELEFTTSVVIRTDRVVVDPARRYTVRLEQIFSPSSSFERSLSAHVLLREPPAEGSPQTPGRTVRDLGTFDGVPRDLRDAPFLMDLDLAGITTGDYQLAVNLADDTRPIGTVTLAVHLRQGLDALVARLESDAARAPADVRADILFPVDRMRYVNRGSLALRTFNPERDFADAQAVAAAASSGHHPFETRKGDFKRHYRLDIADEILPYRMYVPTSYDGSRPFPLIVALHGLGGTEDSFFENYDRAFPPLAERHGYIVAAPMGYRVDGFYGWGLGTPPADPATRRVQERSEADVMEVLRLVRQQYKIDETRIYLAGHSMGAIGTWRIGPKYPDLWAAMAMFAGQGDPSTLERIRHVPQIAVHGDKDPTVNVRGSRAMVARARELGMEITYIEVPGGNHSNVVAPNMPAVFEFFNAHRKQAPQDR